MEINFKTHCTNLKNVKSKFGVCKSALIEFVLNLSQMNLTHNKSCITTIEFERPVQTEIKLD